MKYFSLLMQDGNTAGRNGSGSVDPESVRLIGNAVSTVEKFIVKKEITNPRLLLDYQVVDLSLLKSAIESADR